MDKSEKTKEKEEIIGIEREISNKKKKIKTIFLRRQENNEA